MEEWQSKPMHGQFLRQTKDLSSNDTWQWLQRGELKKKTEGMIMVAQDRPSTKNKIHLNVGNATRKTKSSIISTVNAQH